MRGGQRGGGGLGDFLGLQLFADFGADAHQVGPRGLAKVHGWLIQKKEVLAFVQAKPLEGGAGALLVLLASSQSMG